MIDTNYNTSSKTVRHTKENTTGSLLKIKLSMIYKHYSHKDKTGLRVYYMSAINTTHQ